jgi:hypothetical protein
MSNKSCTLQMNDSSKLKCRDRVAIFNLPGLLLCSFCQEPGKGKGV